MFQFDHMGYKGWRKDGKTFIWCYTIALKFWDEFNVNFVLLYFSSYRSIKMWNLYLKNVEENNKAVHLRLLLNYLFYHLKTCINATDLVTCIIAIESVSCIVPTETVTCRIDYRNFHLQKWRQSEVLLVTTKKLSKRVSTNFKANSFSTPCIT